MSRVVAPSAIRVPIPSCHERVAHTGGGCSRLVHAMSESAIGAIARRLNKAMRAANVQRGEPPSEQPA